MSTCSLAVWRIARSQETGSPPLLLLQQAGHLLLHALSLAGAAEVQDCLGRGEVAVAVGGPEVQRVRGLKFRICG